MKRKDSRFYNVSLDIETTVCFKSNVFLLPRIHVYTTLGHTGKHFLLYVFYFTHTERKDQSYASIFETERPRANTQPYMSICKCGNNRRNM